MITSIAADQRRSMKLGELVSFRTGKLDSNASVSDGMYPFFTCSPHTLRTNSYSFDGEYVLLAGNNANGVFPIKYYVGRFDAYQRTYAIRSLNDTVLCTKYLFYALQMKLELLKTYSTGAATKFLTLKILNDVDIDVPPLPTQRRIASILSAYDDLIENNTRRIAILEEMAQSLYREWFVHFRYPGHEHVPLVDSPLGPVPEGWRVCTLDESATIVMGQSPSSEFYNQDGVGLPFHQGVTDFGHRFPTDRVYCTAENRIAEAGDILFSVRAPVGRINLANKKIVIGRGLSAIRSKTDHQIFLYHQLRETFAEEDIIGNGAIFKAVTKKDMLDLHILTPPAKLRAEFENCVEPAFQQVACLIATITNLRRTRDLLLPKLIRGEIETQAFESGIGDSSIADP